MTKFLSSSRIADLVHSLPRFGAPAATGSNERVRSRRRPAGDPQMREDRQLRAVEETIRRYEEELTRLRVENEQLRRSSQAFGELAERLNVALHTATRVNRKTADDAGGRMLVRASES